MYTNRRTFVIKRGHMREAIELFTTWEPDRPYRVYGNNGIAPVEFDTITIESDFESLAEYEAYFEDWFNKPGENAMQESINKITAPGGRNEILKRLK